jgi:lysophospholipase L1-like esterase
VDRASRVLLNPGSGSTDPRHYVLRPEIERFVAEVQEGYRSIVVMRDAADSVNNGVPIVVHGYDFPTPRNSPARFFTARLLGPWLHKAFNEKAIAEAMRVPISDYLLNVLAEAIAVLASGPSALPAFHFVDTRGTLQRAADGAVGLSGDWLNEIHPSQTGYRKIADRVEAKILSLLAA